MNHADAPRAPENPSAGDGSRRRWLITAVGAVLTPAVALIATGLLLTSPDDGQDDDRVRRRAAESEWAEGITPEWMSERMGLDVPDAARSPRAAYEVTSRFDTGLLTFTLTRPQAERYLEEHPPRGRWLEPTSAQTDPAPHDFTHLGLPEPETFKKGMRYGYVCPGAAGDAQSSSGPYDTSDERCVRLYAHEYAPKRTHLPPHPLRTRHQPTSPDTVPLRGGGIVRPVRYWGSTREGSHPTCCGGAPEGELRRTTSKGPAASSGALRR